MVTPRGADGNGRTTVSGELKEWHKVAVDIAGPWAHERDQGVNPFVDYRVTIVFTHGPSAPVRAVPAYFAADGNAADTGAEAGNVWRALISPDKPESGRPSSVAERQETSDERLRANRSGAAGRAA